MKKILSIVMTMMLALGGLSGCGSAAPAEGSADVKTEATADVRSDGGAEGNDDKLEIVTTIFPEYDWVKSIMGEKVNEAELTMLLDNGVDLHSYQPTAEDILKISTCDLFIYVGGESDKWVSDALSEVVNKDQVVINLLDTLGDEVKSEEIVEGMEHDHDHEHEEGEEHEDHEHDDADHDEDDHDDADHEDEDHDHDDADHEDEEHDHEDEDHEHEEHEHETDEHVWLSLENTEVICSSIGEALKQIDPANADTYQKNLDNYITELDSLDNEYEKVTEESEKDTLLFGDRFPFRYFTDDYDLNYYAAFAGCSAETEASFETVVFLAKKVDELGLSTIMTIEGTDHTLAETIKSNTTSKDQKILSLDSMQSTTSEDVASGVTYLSVMKSNLEVLKEALK
ncbi:MAG: metal ABC transporter substrate-binding protein [Lachnospiraceae bacterium]|nr:metal ABC transporter substrate-binding protein [Lachnospiraceae bacterium]